MSSRALLLLLLLALALALAVAFASASPSASASAAEPQDLPASVQRGLAHGRSGRCLRYRSQLDQTPVDALLAPLSGAAAVVSSSSVESVGDAIARSLRAAPLAAPSSAPAAPSPLRTDMPDGLAPLANVLLVVEALGAQSVERQSLAGVASLAALGSGRSVSLTGHSYPRSSLSSLVSLASARPQSDHGIVGDSWVDAEGRRVEAFTAPLRRSAPFVTNFADSLVHSFAGRSAVVSLSANPQAAAALSLHPAVRAAYPYAPVLTYAPNNAGDFGFDATRDQLLQSFSMFESSPDTSSSIWTRINKESAQKDAADKRISVSYDSKSSKFAVQMGADASNVVHFPMKNAAHFNLFAELELAFALPQLIRGSHAASAAFSDSIPDVVSVHFAGYAALLRKEGADDECVVAASRLLDAALPIIAARLQHDLGVPAARVMSELVLLGSPELFNAADDELFNSADCASAQQSEQGVSLLALSTKVHSQQRIRVQDWTNLTGTGTTTPPTSQQVQTYQIVLWFSVVIVFTLLFVIYAFCNMELRRDSLLYGKFNPNWTHRSGGRH